MIGDRVGRQSPRPPGSLILPILPPCPTSSTCLQHYPLPFRAGPILLRAVLGRRTLAGLLLRSVEETEHGHSVVLVMGNVVPLRPAVQVSPYLPEGSDLIGFPSRATVTVVAMIPLDGIIFSSPSPGHPVRKVFSVPGN